MKPTKSDILWKVVLEEVFTDFLKFVCPDADAIYDLERGCEFLDKELAELAPQPDEAKDTRFADKLVKVYHRDGAEECVLLHVEIQEDVSDREAFAERMYTYFYRIRDRYPGRRISALAIFTGKDGKKMPGRYHYEYRGTKLTYEYSAISILDYSDEELDKSDNPFAQVILAAKIKLLEGKVTEKELLRIKLEAARKLQKKGFTIKKTRSIFNFLRNYVIFEDRKMNRKFDIGYRKTDKIKGMGIDEYCKMEGREEAQAEFVENLLRECLFPDEKIASLANVSVKFVNEVKDELSKVR